jgi:hypothetical protein
MRQKTAPENGLIGRIIRVLRSLNKFFLRSQPCFHGGYLSDFRLWVPGMACAWSRRQVSKLW